MDTVIVLNTIIPPFSRPHIYVILKVFFYIIYEFNICIKNFYLYYIRKI